MIPSLILSLLPVFTFAETAHVQIHPDQILGAVNRAVLGNNTLGYLHNAPEYSLRGSGQWDPEARRPVPELVGLAQAIGTPFLRWPGGCEAHEFNWRLAVGPPEERPQQLFGLPEFLQVCQAVGATPMITLADYWGGPEDAADLVEYLNAPPGANPTGGQDWAAVRTADGHPDPFGVLWFEYGNETNHGAHRTQNDIGQGQRWTAEEYAARYRRYREAMRAADPSIRLGAVLDNAFDLSDWTRKVVADTADIADFYIHHPYLPYYYANKEVVNLDHLFGLTLAASRVQEAFFRRLDAFIRETAGRRIPLALTEFNGHFVQEQPVPYRYSLGVALEVADMLRVFLQPDLPIANAQYWQFSNEYWGMVKGYAPPYVLRPAYHVFALYQRYLGQDLVATEVECDAYETDGGFGVPPMRGEPQEFKLLPGEEAVGTWELSRVNGAHARVVPGGALEVTIETEEDLNFYHARLCLPAEPRTGYRVTAELRAEGLTRRGAQLQVGDGRGWLATRSIAMTEEVRSPEWTPVQADYVTLPDAESIEILARRLEGGREAGKFCVRHVRVQRFQPENLGAVPYLTALASRSRDGSLSLLLLNRHLHQPITATVAGVPEAVATAETLTGPSVDATNEENPFTVQPRPLAVERTPDGWRVILPPHSLTAVRWAAERQE